MPGSLMAFPYLLPNFCRMKEKIKQPLVSAILLVFLLVYPGSAANAGKKPLQSAVSRAGRVLEKSKNAALRCIVTVNDALINSFQELLCINDSGGRDEVTIYVELSELFNSLQLISPDPPPSYTPEFTADWFRAMNPGLWLRLGLDHLRFVHCESCQDIADYQVTVHMARNRLALQAEQPGSPDLDIMLQDVTGNEFSLSELPVEWLNSPEIIATLESISARNTRQSLRTLASGLNQVRRIVGMMRKRKAEDKLIPAVKRARIEGVDLKAYRSGTNQDDLIDNYLKYNDGEGCLDKLVSTGSLPVRGKHLKTVLGKRKRGMQSYYELDAVLWHMERSGAPAEPVQTPGGNLISWALMNNADRSSLQAITIPELTKYHCPVTVGNLLEFLRRPLQPGELLPFKDIPPEDKRESDILDLFVDQLEKQGVKVANIETEYGNLADFALAVKEPRYYELYGLYFDGMVEASMAQLLKAIEYDTVRTIEKNLYLPGLVMGRLIMQGVDLKNWRSPQGETIVQVARRLGAREGILSMLADTDPPIPPVTQAYELRTAKARKKQMIDRSGWQFRLVASTVSAHRNSISTHANYEVSNPEAYRRSVRLLLKTLNYQAIDVSMDGACFYHALQGMFGISGQRLRGMILTFLKAIQNQMHSIVALTPAQQSVLNWFGQEGISEAIHEVESGAWGTHNLLVTLPHILSQQLFNFPGLYAITPSPEGEATITHFTSQGPVSVATIPDHAPVIISNGSDHWYYGTGLAENMETLFAVGFPFVENTAPQNNTTPASTLPLAPAHDLPILPVIFE